MRLAIDASIVLPLVAFDTDEAGRLREWTDDVLAGDPGHVLRNLTPLEVTSALRRFAANGEVEPDFATTIQRRMFGWPFEREDLTQPQFERIWELRHNFTPYDAAYLAIAETLQARYLD